MPKFSAYMKGGDGSPGVPGASIIDGILSSSTELPDYPNHGKHAYLVGTSNPKHLWVWNEENNQWEDEGTTASQIGNITASATTIPWDSEPSVQTQFSTSNQIDSFNFDFNIPMGRPAGFGASSDIVATTTDWDGDITATITTDGPDYAKNFHFDFKIPVGKPAGFGEISVTTESLSSESQPWVSISTDEQSPDDAKGFNFAFGIPKGTAAGFSTGQHVTVSTLDTGEYATVEITTVTSSPEIAKEFNFHFGLPRGDALAIYDGITFTSTEDGIDYHWENRNGTNTLIFNRGTVKKLPVYIYNNNNENIASTFKISTSTIEYEADEKFDGTMYLMMPATLQNVEIGTVSSTTYEHEPVISKSTGSTSTDLILDFVIPKGEKGESNDISKTISGNITSFDDGAEAPVGDLTVAIEPVQDLHGYDNPWPAGGGKNLLDLSSFNTTTKNGITFTVTKDSFGTVTKIVANGTATANAWFGLQNFYLPDGNYILSGCPSGGSGSTYELSVYIPKQDEGYTYFADIGSGKSFSLPYNDTNIINFQIGIRNGNTVNNLEFYPMIRLASETDDAFTPYSNICPISGWTGANVIRTGKNLLPKLLTTEEINETHFSLISDGNSITIDGTVNGSGLVVTDLCDYFFIKAGTYIFSVGNLTNIPKISNDIYADLRLSTLNIGSLVEHRIQLKDVNASKQITILNDCYMKLQLRTYKDLVINNVTIKPSLYFVSESDATFEPSQRTTYPISWENEAGTVYGGSLDVTTGVLTVTHVTRNLPDDILYTHYNKGTTSDRFGLSTEQLAEYGWEITIPSQYTTQQFSSHFSVNSSGAISPFGYFRLSPNFLTIYNNNFKFASPEELQSYLQNQRLAGTPVQVCYKIAEPITYQLTPTEVTTLLGQNNIWADTGNNKILYFKNTEDGKSAGQILNNILTSKTNEAPLDDKAYTRLNGQWTTNITSYGYCTTEIGTAAKTVSIPNFQLVIGSTIFVKFQNANNASNPTLNVNNTGAKPIYRYGTTAASTSSGTNGWQAGSVLTLTYDGTGWIEHYWYNNTYSYAINAIGLGNFTANSAIYRYQLLVHTDREHLSPFNNNNNVTATTKTILTNIEFDPFERIYYYDSTTNVNANSLINGSSLQYTKDNLDLRLIFNINDTTSPLTLNKDVYMKVTPLSNGKVKLASAMPLVQELPSTNDGYWYIFLGRATTRAYGLTLYPDKPVFYHDGTRIRQKFNPYIEKDFRCYHVTATIPQSTTKSFTVIGCTPTMRVINCVFSTPSNVTSNVQWTTTTDLVKFDGTFIGSTDVNFDLIESDTLTAVAI